MIFALVSPSCTFQALLSKCLVFIQVSRLLLAVVYMSFKLKLRTQTSSGRA